MINVSEIFDIYPYKFESCIDDLLLENKVLKSSRIILIINLNIKLPSKSIS